ncbi:hypothetical protein QBC35DRAFT_279153 [Podospora australis]|uniref:DUF7707 domain-containing protein n=1 Tax=Podospora australis TaxID=1536484 RepID=A0AAN6X256_9PEZI|nr:hypothetical protein QBC35DRAFT_279153 [Podospora australis]
MVSFRSTLLALASAMIVSADYYVDPTTVSLSDRKAWCNDQRSVCPIICLQTSTGEPLTNECNADTLFYGCLCSDNKQPNLTEYTLTLPYHMCTRWGTNCVAACGSNNNCAAACREEHPCGARNPTLVNTTSTSSTASSASHTATGDVVFNGFAGDLNSDNNDNSGNKGTNAGALSFGNAYAGAVAAAGLFAGFALVL